MSGSDPQHWAGVRAVGTAKSPNITGHGEDQMNRNVVVVHLQTTGAVQC